MKKEKLLGIGILCFVLSIGIIFSFAQIKSTSTNKEIQIIEKKLIDLSKKIKNKSAQIQMLKNNLEKNETEKTQIEDLKNAQICVLANLKKMAGEQIQESTKNLCFPKKKL